MNFILLDNISISGSSIVAIIILGIILAAISIVAILYSLIILKRMGNAAKKIDYFFEDLSYKSEMLNSSVDTIAKLSNYIDVFDAFTKRNIKSWAKVATKNKDIIFKLVDKLRDFANSED